MLLLLLLVKVNVYALISVSIKLFNQFKQIFLCDSVQNFIILCTLLEMYTY